MGSVISQRGITEFSTKYFNFVSSGRWSFRILLYDPINLNSYENQWYYWVSFMELINIDMILL